MKCDTKERSEISMDANDKTCCDESNVNFSKLLICSYFRKPIASKDFLKNSNKNTLMIWEVCLKLEVR